MRRLRAWMRRTAELFRPCRREHDLTAELEAHLALHVDELVRRGLGPDEARRQARLALGVEAAKEQHRDRRGMPLAAHAAKDLQWAVRGLRRGPAFTTVAVLTLGLGIGASVTIFSVADAALFKPLPYESPQELYELVHVRNRGTGYQVRLLGSQWQDIDALRATPQLIAGVALFDSPQPVPVGDVTDRPSFVGRVSPELIDLLGVRPLVGRSFTEDEVRGGSLVVLLAESFWRTTYASDTAVIGQSLRLDGRRHAIVGVMPATFRWGVGGERTVAWTPFDERTERQAAPGWQASVIRLTSGVSPDSAAPQIAARLAQTGAGTVDLELHPFDSRRDHFGSARTVLAVLLGAVGFVLLIACANVASLLLARGADRRGELAVRTALGATRRRLIAQLLVEGGTLAVLGGALGLVLTYWGATAIPNLLPSRLQIFQANSPDVDLRALLFCLATVVATTLLCSLIPALGTTRGLAVAVGSPAARVAGSKGGGLLRRGLLAGQAALVLALLCGMGLLAASFLRVVTADPGYDLRGLLAASVNAPEPLDSGAQRQLLDDALARIRQIPLVSAATFGTPPGGLGGRVVAEGREDESVYTSVHSVAPDYFLVLGISLREGRLFGEHDTPAAPPAVIVDETLAAFLWRGDSAVGKQVRTAPSAPWSTVVGVVGSIRPPGFAEEPTTFQIYRPATQSEASWRGLMVRSDSDPAHVARLIRQASLSVDDRLTVESLRELQNDYEEMWGAPRFYLVLMSALALFGLVMAGVGLYATASYGVRQRRREIGIRLALGAAPARLARRVIADAFRPVLAGAVLGLALAYLLSRFLGTLLYDTDPLDPIAFGAALAVLLAVALLGAAVPARHAARIDPARTLRIE
jgi:predicted permease